MLLSGIIDTVARTLFFLELLPSCEYNDMYRRRTQASFAYLPDDVCWSTRTGKLERQALSLGAVVSGANIQKQDLTLPSTAAANRDAAKLLFTNSYNAYKQYAWGHDDLAPISKGYVDSRNGWGASIVDALSTLHIMGLTDDFKTAVDFASKIDFSKSKTSDTVSVFETTIRFVGGLLSAYELSGKQYPALLSKAKEVTDKLAFAWSGTRSNPDIPYGYLDFATNKVVDRTANIAEAGTLVLEWETLTKYTGNSTYRTLTERALKHIATLPAPLPGLAAQGINPKTGAFIGGYVTWSGGSDSYFEYLIKHARLSNTDDSLYASTWLTAVDSSIKTLLKKSTVGNWSYIAEYDDSKRIRHSSSNLACFHAGNWLMGGRLLNNQTIVNIALDLNEGCWNTYASTATGIGPESWSFISSDGDYTGGTITDAQRAYNAKYGYYPRTPAYILRPEVLESNFYAWRVTGNTKYLDRAASTVKNFEKWLKTGVAYAGITDVNNVSSNRSFYDDMESFWFAEVLKYLYLTFDDPTHISLDNYVFNTEAHPFIAPPAKSSYGAKILAAKTEPFKVQSGDLPEVSPSASKIHL